MTDVNWAYCGDHFATNTNIKPLRCTPVTNEMSITPQLKITIKRKII